MRYFIKFDKEITIGLIISIIVAIGMFTCIFFLSMVTAYLINWMCFNGF